MINLEIKTNLFLALRQVEKVLLDLQSKMFLEKKYQVVFIYIINIKFSRIYI